jgi:hypothetical protein
MPTFDLNSGRLDAKRIDGGVWWAIHLNADRTFGGRPLRGDPGEEPALLVRPADIEWERALDTARKPYRTEIREHRLSPADERKIMAEAIARALWRGCKNITVGKEPLVWSEAAAARMLADKEWWSLADFILAAAQSRAALVADEEAKASGN